MPYRHNSDTCTTQNTAVNSTVCDSGTESGLVLWKQRLQVPVPGSGILQDQSLAFPRNQIAQRDMLKKTTTFPPDRPISNQTCTALLTPSLSQLCTTGICLNQINNWWYYLNRTDFPSETDAGSQRCWGHFKYCTSTRAGSSDGSGQSMHASTDISDSLVAGPHVITTRALSCNQEITNFFIPS